MRESLGYAPVLSHVVPVACGVDSAASRSRRRRAPSPEPCHVGPARQVISLVLITVNYPPLRLTVGPSATNF